MSAFAIPAKGILFLIKLGSGRQPWHYQVVGGNGEPETSSETFSNARDCVRRIEGHWLGFCIAMGWHPNLGMPPPIPFHADSAGHNLPSACKLGYSFRGITNKPTPTARRAVRELQSKPRTFTVTGIKDLKDKIDSMKIGGLSRKSLKRAVAKSAKLIETQLKPITPAMKRAAAKFATDRQKARHLRAMR